MTDQFSQCHRQGGVPLWPSQGLSPPESSRRSSLFPLSQAQAGERLWIVEVTAREGLLERLVGMGLNRETELVVLSQGNGGSLMVAIANTRLGLGQEMAAAIQVRRSPVAADTGRSLSHPGPLDEKPDSKIDKPDERENLMSTQTHLRDLSVGATGRIARYERGMSTYRQKLLAMGLTPGTEFTITRQAPLGDPVELRVRGFQLSLRKAEADALIVEALNHG